MWEEKLFDFVERIFNGVAKFSVNRLTAKEDKVHRKIERINSKAKSEIDFAHRIVHKAECRQMRGMLECSDKVAAIETAYTKILNKAGV